MHRMSYIIVLCVFAVEFGISNAVDCDLGECANNASWVNFDATPNIPCYADATDVTLVCSGDGQNVTLTCTDETWSDETVACRVYCLKPTVGEDVILVGLTKDEYAEQETIQFSCNETYQKPDPPQATCVGPDQWDPTDEPTCNAYCSTLNVENGDFNQTEEVIEGTTGTVTCKDGYKIEGDTIVECGSDGSWSGELQCNNANRNMIGGTWIILATLIVVLTNVYK